MTNKNVSKVKVYYKDTDAEGVVYYANYLGWLEVGRTELINDLGISLKKIKEDKGIVFAIREVDCKYLAPALYADELDVVTSIEEVTGATVVFRQLVVRPKDDVKILDAKVIAFAMDMKKMRPAKIPSEFRDGAGL